MRGRPPKATSSLGARLSLVCLSLTLSASAVVLGCRPSPRRIAQVLADSTLTVQTFDAEGNPLGQGTAFFIAPDTVLTNMHVMKWAKTLKVSSPSRGLSFDIGSVVGVNFDRDLCVLRTTSKEGRPLRFAKKGTLAVGDKVYVSGNPKGLQGTVSTGIVSAVREEGHLIQIDAPISPGSSGGPVVNEQGEVIGIATLSVVQGQNLNFAVGLLEGPDVRTVDWPVFDVGFTALSSLERSFLKGPVRRVRSEPTMWLYLGKGGGRNGGEWHGLPFEARVWLFNRNGMQAEEELLAWNFDAERYEDRSSESWAYHDSRVMSLHKKGGEVERFTYDCGRVVGAEAGVAEWHNVNESRYWLNAFGLTTEFSSDESKTVYRFDAAGREIEETKTRRDERVSGRIFSYEGDSHGNWIRKIDQYGNVDETRTIDYYD